MRKEKEERLRSNMRKGGGGDTKFRKERNKKGRNLGKKGVEYFCHY